MTDVTESLNAPSSRRAFLQVFAAAGAGLVGAGALTNAAFAQATAADTAQDILNIAATAEQLAVVFYTNAIANASTLKINAQDLSYLQAGLIEEQIHENFLLAAGAKPLTSTFSFPGGAATFTDQTTFVNTLTGLEAAFVAAYTAATYEFAQMGSHDLARVAGMIGSVEAQHYALGRVIGEDFNVPNTTPANNWAFAPQLIATVGAGPKALSGFLAPATGNTFTYTAIDLTSSTYAPLAAGVQYQMPFIAGTMPLAATLVTPRKGVPTRPNLED